MSTTRRTTGHLRAAVLLTGVVALTVTTVPSAAASSPEVIVLPGASSAEGIAAGRGPPSTRATFSAATSSGATCAGPPSSSSTRRTAARPSAWRRPGTRLLFVAGGFTGQAYVYDPAPAPPSPPTSSAPPEPSVINDVAVTRRGAWFTDTKQASSTSSRSTGTASRAVQHPGTERPGRRHQRRFNLNGIRATADGRTLIVAHSAKGELYTVDRAPGTSATIAGVSVPTVDGIVLRGRRLWAVQNSATRSPGSGSAATFAPGRREVITSDLSRSRRPPPGTATGSPSSTPSSTPASRPPPTSTRSSSSTADPADGRHRRQAVVPSGSLRARYAVPAANPFP